MRPLVLVSAAMWVGCTGDIIASGGWGGNGGLTGTGGGAGGAGGADQGVPFPLPVCNPTAAPLATPLRRLTRAELEASLTDVFGAQVDVSTWVTQLPADDLSKGAQSFDNRYTQLHSEVLLELAVGVGERATSTDAKVDALLRANSGCTLATVSDSCAKELIGKLGLRLFRRPLTSADVDAVFALYRSGVSPRDRFAVAVSALLLSPELLYHVELGTPGVGTDAQFPLSAFETASRLSYGLTGTAPSAPLQAKAASGQLGTPAQVEAAATELLQSPQARARTQDFFAHWLGTHNPPGVPSNPNFLAGIDTNGLRAEMARELGEFVDHVVWTQKAGYVELFTSKRSFARTPALAQIYGHPLATDPVATEQQFAPGRMGLMLRGPVLTSPDDFSHPLPRGARLRTEVLCDTLGMPSAEAFAALSDALSAEAVKMASGRQRFEAKTAAGSCKGCHTLVNPLGFPLEGFDSLGRQRATEVSYDQNHQVIAEHPLDLAVRDLAIDRTKGENATGAVELIDAIAHSEKGPLCMARQLHRFFALRTERLDSDACLLLEMKQHLQNGSILDAVRSHASRVALSDKVVSP